MNQSIIKETAKQSPLQWTSTLNPQGGRRSNMLIATVMLTSLVDAFSILVIYLLVSSSSSGEMLYISKDMKLPEAQQASILKRNTLIRIEKDKLFIEDKEVEQKSLVKALIAVRKDLEQKSDDSRESITIQADKKTTYKFLNEIVLASSHAGFSNINFAVLSY